MKCSACNLAVIIINSQLIKACNCTAPIVADLSARCVGAGGVKK